MKGVNVNCKEIDFVEKIFAKQNPKTIETRNSGSLDSLLGQRVAIIKTGCGKAMCCGFVTIGKIKRIVTDEETFQHYYQWHYVPSDSKTYAFKTEKHMYQLYNATPCEPFPVPNGGRVIRNLDIKEEDYVN